MNLEDYRTSLIQIQTLAVQQVGYLEAVRDKLPLSPGGSDELAQSIDINRRILAEVKNGQAKIPTIIHRGKEAADYVGADS